MSYNCLLVNIINNLSFLMRLWLWLRFIQRSAIRQDLHILLRLDTWCHLIGINFVIRLTVLSDFDKIFTSVILFVVSPPYFTHVPGFNFLGRFPVLPSFELICLDLSHANPNHPCLARFDGPDSIAITAFIQGRQSPLFGKIHILVLLWLQQLNNFIDKLP